MRTTTEVITQVSSAPAAAAQVNGTHANGVSPDSPLRQVRRARQHTICISEAIIGSLFMAAWVVLFAAGNIIGTQPYRERLANPGDFITGLRLWFVVLTCYTATNVAILCCLSSYLGTLGRRARIGGNERFELEGDGLRQYTAAVMRGFFVFVGLVSGTVALTGPAVFTNTTPETYLRLAATASLVSFLAGYKPQLFSRLQGRLDDWIVDRVDDSDPSNRASPEAAAPVVEHTAVITEHTR